MALPTLSKTWKFQVNQNFAATGTVLTNSRNLLMGIKNSMIGAGSWTDAAGAGTSAPAPFTTVTSCDSAAVGGAGVDKWDTNTDLVWANAGSAHSWYVLRNTSIATNYEVMISCSGASAGGVLLTVAVSPSAAFTGGSTTADPTATDSVSLLSNAAWGGNAADIAHRLHAMVSTDGQCYRNVISANGFNTHLGLFDKPKNPVTGWTNPSASLWLGTSAASTNIITNTTTNGTANVKGRGSASMSMFCTGEDAAGTLITVTQTAANSLSGEYPLAGVGLFSTTASHIGRHGELFDLYWALSNLAEGDNFPGSGTVRQFATFGEFAFPWNQSVISTS